MYQVSFIVFLGTELHMDYGIGMVGITLVVLLAA